MSKVSIRKYVFHLLLFSVIILAIGAVFQLTIPLYASPAIPFIVIFFFLVTFITLYIVMRMPRQVSGKKFIASYMVSRIIKMVSVFLFFILYILFNKEDRWTFAGAFLIIYFSYSIFEIIALKKDQ